MSINKPLPPLSISPTELDTCIRVLSVFKQNDAIPSFDSSEFTNIRRMLHNLYHLGKRRNRTAEQINSHEVKRIGKKVNKVRLNRIQSPQQYQLHSSAKTNDVPHMEIDNDNQMDGNVIEAKSCFICNFKYRTSHIFYDRLCPSCAIFNYEKRLQTTDLSKCVALVTGGRLRIGYRIVLKLLRANCFVIVTTRFPMDALKRFIEEYDFEQWKDRIHIYGVDFRYSQLLELFTEMFIEKYDRLDFLINNACQTIRKSNESYQHLFSDEQLTSYSRLTNDQQKILEGNLQFYKRFISFYRSQDATSLTSSTPFCLPYANDCNDTVENTSSIISHTSPNDGNQQVVHFEPTNSLLLRLNDVSTLEINEVLTVNTLAPFILNSKLKVLMADKHPNPDSIKFIINVSSAEGSFSDPQKTDRHPHINATKAAVNMITRTSAQYYVKSNIYMVSVDTGFKNDENRIEKPIIDQDFQIPFDDEDAAARVLDPIIATYRQLASGKTNIDIPFGCILKDFHRSDW